MTELGNTIGSATRPAYAGMTSHASKRTADAAGRGIRLIRRIVVVNLALAALQPVTAGFFLSGYGLGTTVHSVLAMALLVGALIQAVTGSILWRGRRVPAWVAGMGIGLLVMVCLQFGFGYRKVFWLHVPIGVGIVVGLIRQATMLDRLPPAAPGRS